MRAGLKNLKWKEKKNQGGGLDVDDHDQGKTFFVPTYSYVYMYVHKYNLN